MNFTNRQVLLAARPVGFPKESDFTIADAQLPQLLPGEVLIRVLLLSVDPYMRGRMSAAKSYAKPVEIGEVMTGGAAGVIVASASDAFPVGTHVAGDLGWQEYAIRNPAQLRMIDPTLAPLSTSLGVLGMTGLTAYFGLLDVGQLKQGETVLVSGAAGAVGSIVGQIAKLKSCRVVGIAGTDEKVDFLIDELGFDAALNYKSTKDYTAKFAALCPSGIDVYFDNVGGEITDAVIPLLNIHARIAVCGQISQYNLEQPESGPRWLHQLIIKRAKAHGFLVSDFSAQFPKALTDLTAWYKAGKLKFPEQIAEGGIDAAPAAFIGMLHGDNLGKQLVRVSNSESEVQSQAVAFRPPDAIA